MTTNICLFVEVCLRESYYLTADKIIRRTYVQTKFIQWNVIILSELCQKLFMQLKCSNCPWWKLLSLLMRKFLSREIILYIIHQVFRLFTMDERENFLKCCFDANPDCRNFLFLVFSIKFALIFQLEFLFLLTN